MNDGFEIEPSLQAERDVEFGDPKDHALDCRGLTASKHYGRRHGGADDMPRIGKTAEAQTLFRDVDHRQRFAADSEMRTQVIGVTQAEVISTL